MLDPNTAKIVSMVYSQTQILEKEVYLVEILGKEHAPMLHMKAVVFMQPTEANYDLLVKELIEPKFKEYHLFFSNVVPQDMLARLARLDEHDLIMQVQEYYGDYMAINRDLFHLNIDNSLVLSSQSRTLESNTIFERNVNGICSVLLSLKKIPAQIRYQGSSDLARRLANDVLTNITKGEPFDYARQEGMMLLILDRREDPITPLLTQWTYQAMVHELLGLNYNRVVLEKVPNVPADMKEVVLSVSQDEFFANNYTANFGDLGSSVKSLLDEYQKHSKKNESISSIEDMQNFLERYPDFRSKSINITKHVTVISELSRLVDMCQLLDISEVEQEIACANDHATHKLELLKRIRSTKVMNADKVRLAILFLLKYESYNEINEIKAVLSDKGLPELALRQIDSVLNYAGEARRGSGLLFSGQGLLSKISNSFTNVQGVQNVYTQHQPVLYNTLQGLVQSGKLKDQQFPPLVTGSAPAASLPRPSEVIIFIVGGATYEEATRITELNKTNSGIRFILGGSNIQNSTTFLKEIVKTFG